MTAERAIQIAVFVLLLAGFWSISAWASYNYLQDVVLVVAGIALSWGIVLLVLYVVFKRLDWNWWSPTI
ncbi:MAG: hypothetical protein QXU99_02035 [Candidatus Bathyarchaeia archaeon]